MEDKRITAEEILAEIDVDVKQTAQKVADTINNARREPLSGLGLMEVTFPSDTNLSIAATETILQTNVFRYGVGSSSLAPPSFPHML